MKRQLISLGFAGLLCSIVAMARAADSIAPLHVQGEQFVDAAGQPVRFWGVNLVAVYPAHDVSDKLAANLAAYQVNLVRPHHMLRSSRDWVTKAPMNSLLLYKDNSRDWDTEAWDRFDYLNAQLRKQGIYLQLAVGWTRKYHPGDAAILQTTPDDAAAWSKAVEELNSWPWQKSFDPTKMLAVIDERAALINEEFATRMLAHRNPYSQKTYAEDPQVLTLELINEFSSEYAILCMNQFPDYFKQKLTDKWQAFAKSHGAEGGDLYKPTNKTLARLRAEFLRDLDEAYLTRMKKVIRDSGSKAAITFSNLWRGDSALGMQARGCDYIEDHEYNTPFVAAKANDFVLNKSNSAVAGKPLILGEFNESEGEAKIRAESPTRSMLPLAASAYGCFQNWSGIVWFAWLHGDRDLADSGEATVEKRESNIGGMITDGMMLDHLRTAGIIFRRGLVSPSVKPIVLLVSETAWATDYHGLMRGQLNAQPGWQSIHGIRKTFSSTVAVPTEAFWTKPPAEGPLISDTGQIIKDIARKQLTVKAPQTEAFSGMLDAGTPAGLNTLKVSGSGFATVIVVAADGVDLPVSGHLIISRSNIDAEEKDVVGPQVRLEYLKPSAGGKAWHIRTTRPREPKENDAILSPGAPLLPGSTWYECELEYR